MWQKYQFDIRPTLFSTNLDQLASTEETLDPKMPNFSAQCVKGVQGIGYLCAFILSLAICVPMSMHQDQFKGRCLLFSTGHWQEQVKRLFLKLQNCQKLIFIDKRGKSVTLTNIEKEFRLSMSFKTFTSIHEPRGGMKI